MSNIGSKIKQFRENTHLSQYELADKVGVSQKAVSAWETGRAEPGLDTAAKIAKVLGVPIQSLVLDEQSDVMTLTEEEKFFIDALRNATQIQKYKAYHELIFDYSSFPNKKQED